MNQYIVVPQQDAIEVFVNDGGSISISVFDHAQDERNLIVVQPIFVEILIRALREAKREAKDMAVTKTSVSKDA